MNLLANIGRQLCEGSVHAPTFHAGGGPSGNYQLDLRHFLREQAERLDHDLKVLAPAPRPEAKYVGGVAHSEPTLYSSHPLVHYPCAKSIVNARVNNHDPPPRNAIELLKVGAGSVRIGNDGRRACQHA